VALAAIDALATMLPGAECERAQRQCQWVRAALRAAQTVSTATLAPATRNALQGEALGHALRDARLQAIADVLARS
jgi:hypothetical protein